MTQYIYNLKNVIKKDITSFQEDELINNGYIYNSKEDTYDLIEEIKEKIIYVDFSYIEEIEKDVYLNEIEIYETKKIKNVSYKKRETGFLGFFKKISQRFFPLKEFDISKKRELELELLLSKGEILNLEVIEKIEPKKEKKLLTQKELSLLDNTYTFIKRTNLTKQEKEEIIYSRVEKLSIFEKEFSNKKILEKKEFTKEQIKEKIVKDRRKKMITDIYFYIPGVWSRKGNHNNGTIAEFSCNVEIEYISGFNPFESRYLDKSEIREDVIGIIEKEHPNTEYIRLRNDLKDGFSIEKTKVI